MICESLWSVDVNGSQLAKGCALDIPVDRGQDQGSGLVSSQQSAISSLRGLAERYQRCG
jgi:hypothetical protein